MAVLLKEDGRELLWLSVLCNGTPCQSTTQSDPAVMRFLAPRPGRLTMRIRNVAISPACFFSLHRQQIDPGSTWSDGATSLVNDFHLLYRGCEEDVRRDASTGREMLIEPVLSADGSPLLVNDAAAADVPRTRFRLSVSPAVRNSWSPPEDLSHATWQRKTVPRAEQPLNVILKRPTGGVLDFQLDPKSTIREVKLKIEDRIAVSFRENWLTWRGRELDDLAAVNAYAIQHGDILEIKPSLIVIDSPAVPAGVGGRRRVPFLYPSAANYPVGNPTTVSAHPSRAAVTGGRERESEPRARHDRGSPQMQFEVFCHHAS